MWLELPSEATDATELICLVGCRLVYVAKAANTPATLTIFHPCRYGPLTLYAEQAESVHKYVSAGVSIRPKALAANGEGA